MQTFFVIFIIFFKEKMLTDRATLKNFNRSLIFER